jgi:RNA polymerase sigma factor (TIGR02999 family)
MRRILVEQARRKGRAKHGGELQRVELLDPMACDPNDELLALDEALPLLAAEDTLAAEIVKLKYFAGLSRDEIASVLGMTVHEVRQKWTYARAWLRLALES